MREKSATERQLAFHQERLSDQQARMPCQYGRLSCRSGRMSFQIERMTFHRERIRGSFQFARDSCQINANPVPFCAISWGYCRSNICNARSIFREKAFHFRAHAQPAEIHDSSADPQVSTKSPFSSRGSVSDGPEKLAVPSGS